MIHSIDTSNADIATGSSGSKATTIAATVFEVAGAGAGDLPGVGIVPLLRDVPARVVALLQTGEAPPVFTGNRRTRRASGERVLRRFSRFLRSTAVVALVSFLYSGVIGPIAPLAAQTFKDFDDSRSNVESYRDRANRLNDADAWTNYVELGIASEFVQWEEDAYEELRKVFSTVDADEGLDEDQKTFEKNLARAQLDAAALAWQQEAEDYIYEERGAYRASSEDIESRVDQIGDDIYSALIAGVEAQFAGQTSVDLAAWDAAMDAAIAPHSAAFETQLATELGTVAAANTGLTGAELVAFTAELDRVAASVRQEFSFRDSFFVKRARNSYLAERRADDLSARLFAEQSSADSVGDQILAATETELATVDDMIAAAQTETADALDGPGSAEIIDEIAGDWQAKMEAVVQAGLDRWDRAEEDLYSRRLAWLEESQQSREEGEAIWEAQHEKLKTRRTEWVSEIEQQIRAGREQWETKFAEFAQSRQAAEDEMAQFIAEERERRDATLGQIGDMVLGGGAALAEAKDAYRYFSELVTLTGQTSPYSHRNDAALRDFYLRQQQIHGDAINSFTAMLGGVEGVLTDNMQGDANYTGLLRDKRTYAGTLAADVAGLSAANFQSDLVDLMNTQSEDFVLYRRDIESLIESNVLFTDRTAELNQPGVFDYQSAGSLDALLALIDGLDLKYGEHQRELREIYFRTRTAVDDADRLAQIKTDLAAYLPGAADREDRLKREVTAYFNEGLSGYYLTDNENDPYLLTDAEYEWELLRRERNYLAKRFARAEAVKRYADLANQFEAGLEMAQITEERAEVAEIRSDVREMAYLLLKGDRTLDVAFVSDARALVDSREPALNAELALLATYDPADRASSGGEVDAYVTTIDAYLNTHVATADRDTHRLKILRDKLNAYRASMDGGATATELNDRWLVLAGGAQALRSEVNALVVDFDFAGLRAEIDALVVQAGEQTIPQLLADVYVAKETVNLAGVTLTAAKTRLDEARETYHQAYLDFKVLNDPNAKELITNELLNTTDALSRVLHHMQEISDIPGFASRLYDPVTKKRIEYLYGIQQRASAEDAVAYTDVLSDTVLGLEESKRRLQNLETALLAESPDGKLNGQSARDIANFFITNEPQFTERVAATESFRSHSAVLASLDALKAASTQLTTHETQLAQAIADADPAADIEILRARVAQTEETIRRRAEEIIAGIRGEERARREATLRMLDVRDGANNVLHDLDALRTGITTETEGLADTIQAMGQSAAANVDAVLNANRDKTFAEILAVVNTTLAGLARNLEPGDGYTTGAAPPAALTEYRKWEMTRNWLLDNRAAIDRANAAPDEYDRRTTIQKWDALLAAVDDLAEDANYLATFQAALPNSSSDAWVLNYRSERTALLSDVNAALGAADVMTAYAALDEIDRRVLNSYGMNAAVSGGATDFRRALELARENIENDLAGLNENYRTIYLREREIEINTELADVQNEYNTAAARQNADQSERNVLNDDREKLEAAITAAGGSDAILEARRDEIDARLMILNTRIAAREPVVEGLEDQYRGLQRELGEIRSAAANGDVRVGASNALAAYAQANIGVTQTTLEFREWGLRLLENVDRTPGNADVAASDANQTTPVEYIKAAIGMFALDRDGKIIRDASGTPQLTQEFLDLGVTDAEESLGDLFSGGLRGADLERFAERLLDWRADAERNQQIAPETAAAIELIENDLYTLLAARRMIDERYATGDTIVANADAAIANAQQIQNKLSQIAGLEGAIQDALTAARANGGDEARAVLAVLEQKQYAELLYTFEGYNIDATTGALVNDGVTHTAGQERLNDLRRLADRFRVSREEERLAEIVSAYADAGLEFLIRLETDPDSLPVDQVAFLDAYSAELNGSSVIGAVSALGDTDFRANLWSYVATLPSQNGLYKSEIAGVLRANPGDGATLKSAVLAALNALQTRIYDTLEVELGRSDAIVNRDRDLTVETSVAALIAQYATRGSDTQTQLLPTVAAVSDALGLADAKTALVAAIDALGGTSAAAFAGIKRELKDVLNASAAVDTTALKAELSAAINALSDPATADVLTLEGELYLREMKIAQGVSDNSDIYTADDYPEELREFVLVRSYTLAKERYEDYLALKNSSLAEERDAAVLDLSGLMGDFARNILLTDFAAYRAANDYEAAIATALAGDEGPYSIGAYLSGYLEDRQTNGDQLPRGGVDIAEDLAVREYQRITADQAAAGGDLAALAGLDERNYFADYRTYLMLAKVEAYLNGAAYNHAAGGATETDRRAAFTAAFENFLDDATYAQSGLTVRQRLLNSAQLDGLFQAAFARLEQGADLDQYLPAVLDERRFENRLADAPQDPADLIPPELLAIAGYNTLDYRQMAYAVNPQYGKALAQFEAAYQLEEDTALGRLAIQGVGLDLDDSELDQVIDRAGHAALSAADKSLVRTMLRIRVAEMYTTATGGDALTILRNDRAFREYYADPAAERAYELFVAENRTALAGIEQKFSAALNDPVTDGRLREIAGRSENPGGGSRGELLRAVIERSRGATTTYYNSQSAELQTEIDALSTRLFTGSQKFSNAEQTALLAQASAFETYFNFQADQELITSGVFEELEGVLRAAVARNADATLSDYVSANPNTTLRALAEQLYVTEGVQGGLGATAATAMSGHAALQAAIDQAIAGLNPKFKKLLLDEQTLVTKFFEEFIESDEERRHIRDMLRDPSLAHPDQGLALHHDSTKTLILAQAKKQSTADALLRSVEEHSRFFEKLNRDQSREIAVSREVKKFGKLRGNEADFADSRFAQYRTFAGTEREHQEQEYAQYTAGGGAQTFEVWSKGRFLEVESLNITDIEGLLNTDYDAVLTSDTAADLISQQVQVGLDTGTTTDDETIDIRKIRTVGQVNAMSFADNTAELRYTYFANLANNYLEAATKLNAALNSVWTAGELANQRETASAATDIRAAVRATYDANATGPADAADLDVLVTEKQAATAKLASYGEAQLGQAQNAISQLEQQYDQTAQQYADSARRKQLDGIKLIQYAQDTFTTALNELEAANAEMNGAEAASNNGRTAYDQLISDYTDKLDELSGRFRDWQAAEGEKELRLAVLDYANTPYLETGATDASDPTGAQRQYELALDALNSANDRLADAAFNVQTEDRLGDFAQIVSGLEGGATYAPLDAGERDELAELRDRKYRGYETLSAAEETRLVELNHREMYERYGELITARAEHIKHTMRMIRIEKASAIINQEIEQKRLVAEDKRVQFEKALSLNFGNATPTQAGVTQDQAEAARLGVYQRLVSKMESGQPLYDEFRAWYYGSAAWVGQYGGVVSSAYLNGGALSPIGPAASLEILGGAAQTLSVPPADAANFAVWINNGGSIAEYNQFQSTYFGYLMSLMNFDAATISLGITVVAMTPLIGIGYAMIATGTALVAQGTALMATIVGAAAGASMVSTGIATITAGFSQIALATATIASATLVQLFAGLASLFTGVAAFNTATYGSVSAVRHKEIEYQQAQSELDYLTKVPDLATLKDRFKNFGSANEDPEDSTYDLYSLTDEDLIYLLEMSGGTQNWAGATPTAEQQSDALDITGKQNTVEYRDSSGRRYDPADVSDTPPAAMYNGSYGGYTRVLVQSHDRDVKNYKYYRLIDETADSQIAYDMGEVADSLVNHGNALRQDRLAKYLNAGNTAASTDSTFTFRERDATFQSLFEASRDRTNGGREFAGYTTTFSDYAGNQNDVFEQELLQRQRIQTKEWDLREQELNDQYADWEARMNQIVTRGRNAWGTNENIFLQKQREWEREIDADKAAGEALWEQRIAEHFTAKSNWEQNIRNQVTEGNVTQALANAVDTMNAQIATMNANMGTNLETQDRTAAIATAIQQIQNDQPSGTEKLKLINENISKFNTNLSLSELTGTNLGKDLVTINSQYREEMREHRHNMEVYANAKVFEQYMRLMDDLLDQINAQNRATAARTAADAATEGFVKNGAVYMKTSTDIKDFGVVNEYVAFDGAAAIREEQARAGAMHGVRTAGEPNAFDTSAIIAFLENADSVQVQAFFDYQQKAFGIVAERIMGGGTGAERQATYLPDEQIHGRLGVWIGRPADQQVTQGLIAAAGGSYYNDQQALNMVASTAHGYGELGAATLRPSAVSVGFYTQLWWYSQVMGKKQQEAISASFNEGILGTGVAKFYNTYNPFVGFANTYQTAKINSALYGTDQANLWRNEIISGIGGPAWKANQQTGELDYKLTMKDLIGAIPLVGGIINSGIDYDANGNQRRGGWKWNPQEGGAAVTTAAAGLLFSVYGVYGAEYVNKQTYGEQYSNYDQLGVGTGLGSTIGAYAGAIAAAFGMQAANAEFDAENGAGASKGLTRAEADAANATSATHQGAGILQGSGYALGLRRYGNYIGQQVEGIGMGAFDSNGFTGIGAAAGGVANWFAGVAGGSAYSLLNATTNVSQRVGNFFSADFNGERWNWETDGEQAGRAQVFAEDQIRNGDFERARESLLASGAKANQVDDYLNERKKIQTDYAANKAEYLKSGAYLVMGDLVGDNHGYSNNEKYNKAVSRLGELAGNEPPTQAIIEQVALEMHGRPMEWDRAIYGKGLLIGIDQAKFGAGGQALKDFTSGKSNVLPAGILPPNTTLVIDGRRIETDSSGAAVRIVATTQYASEIGPDLPAKSGWFANTSEELARQSAAGAPHAFTDLLKAAFTDSSNEKVSAARIGMARFYSAVLADFGVTASAESVGNVIGTSGRLSNMVAGPDMGAAADSGEQFQQGNYATGAGYAGLAATGIVLSKIKLVGNLGAAGLKKIAPEVLSNSLKTFSTRKYFVGDKILTLDKRGIKHILERHHPAFWNGTIKRTQTFFADHLSLEDVGNIAGEIIKQNRATILNSTESAIELAGKIGAQEVRMVLWNSRVVTLFPR